MESLERKFAPLEKYHIDVVGLCEDTRGEIAFLKSKLGRTDAATSNHSSDLSEEEDGGHRNRGGDGVDVQNHQPVHGDEGHQEEEVRNRPNDIYEQDHQLLQDAFGQSKKMEAGNLEMLANGIDTQDHQTLKNVNEQPKAGKPSNPSSALNENMDLPTAQTAHRKLSRPHPSTTKRDRKSILPSLFHRQEKETTSTRLLLLSRRRPFQPEPPSSVPQPTSSSSHPNPNPPNPAPVSNSSSPRPRRRLSKAHRHSDTSRREGKKHVSWEVSDSYQHTISADEGKGDSISKDEIPEEYWRDIGMAAAGGPVLADGAEKDGDKGKGKGKGKEKENDQGSDTESLRSDITYSEGTEAGQRRRERLVKRWEESRKMAEDRKGG